MFSDGYVDQMGGADRKPFRSGNFYSLVKVHDG